MKKLGFLVSLCFVAGSSLVAGCSSSDSSDATVTVTNSSQSDIVDLKVTAVGDDSAFGANLLDSGALQPGDSITISVVCDTYDVQLTDDTDTTCVLSSIDLCGTDKAFSITEDDLNACAAGFVRKANHTASSTHQATSRSITLPAAQ